MTTAGLAMQLTAAQYLLSSVAHVAVALLVLHAGIAAVLSQLGRYRLPR